MGQGSGRGDGFLPRPFPRAGARSRIPRQRGDGLALGRRWGGGDGRPGAEKRKGGEGAGLAPIFLVAGGLGGGRKRKPTGGPGGGGGARAGKGARGTQGAGRASPHKKKGRGAKKPFERRKGLRKRLSSGRGGRGGPGARGSAQGTRRGEAPTRPIETPPKKKTGGGGRAPRCCFSGGAQNFFFPQKGVWAGGGKNRGGGERFFFVVDRGGKVRNPPRVGKNKAGAQGKTKKKKLFPKKEGPPPPCERPGEGSGRGRGRRGPPSRGFSL